MKTPERPSVLVVGPAYVDLIFAGMDRLVQPGTEVFAKTLTKVPGGAFTTARALHRLGITTRWSDTLGDDEYSALVLAAAEQEGVDVSAVDVRAGPVRRVSVGIVLPDERSFISFDEEVSPPDHPAAILQFEPSHVLLMGWHPKELFHSIALACRTVSAELVVDPQHHNADGWSDLLGEIDVLLPNAAEACAIAGTSTVALALRWLRERVPVTVVKDGADGAVAADEHDIHHVSAPTVHVVDTVGAGDCFDAGFLAARAMGLTFPISVEIGVQCGSLSTTGSGGGGAPSLHQLRTTCRRLPVWAGR